MRSSVIRLRKLKLRLRNKVLLPQGPLYCHLAAIGLIGFGASELLRHRVNLFYYYYYYYYYYIIIINLILLHLYQSVLPKGRSSTANSATKAVVLPKGRSSTANSGTNVAILLGAITSRCFPHIAYLYNTS